MNRNPTSEERAETLRQSETNRVANLVRSLRQYREERGDEALETLLEGVYS